MRRNNFSKAEQGKIYRPIEELEIPVYLDKEIKAFYSVTALKKNTLPPNTYRLSI